MHGLVEVVRRRRRVELPPEHVHRLLAVQPVPGRERQQLHELTCLLQPPGVGGNFNAVDLGCEPTEEAEAHLTHPGNNLNLFLCRGHPADVPLLSNELR